MAKSKSNLFFVADDVHPQVIDVVKERAVHFGFDVVVGPAGEAVSEGYSVPCSSTRAPPAM